MMNCWIVIFYRCARKFSRTKKIFLNGFLPTRLCIDIVFECPLCLASEANIEPASTSFISICLCLVGWVDMPSEKKKEKKGKKEENKYEINKWSSAFCFLPTRIPCHINKLNYNWGEEPHDELYIFLECMKLQIDMSISIYANLRWLTK